MPSEGESTRIEGSEQVRQRGCQAAGEGWGCVLLSHGPSSLLTREKVALQTAKLCGFLRPLLKTSLALTDLAQ